MPNIVRSFIRVSVLAFVTWNSLLIAAAQATSVNITDYITQAASGNMLCDYVHPLCAQGYWDQYGEFAYIYSNGIQDYIARSTRSPYFVGPVRNYSGNDGGSDANIFRCFGNIGELCNAPPDVAYTPQSVPLIFNLNVVSAQTELATRNPDNSPKVLIPGSVSLTNGYQIFSVNVLSYPSCQQTPGGNIAHQVYATMVTNVNFGGDVGTENALVIDETEGNLDQYGTFYPDHIERYYYVIDLGRVMESSAKYDPRTQVYSTALGGASIRNMIQPSNIVIPGVACPQGTAPFN